VHPFPTGIDGYPCAKRARKVHYESWKCDKSGRKDGIKWIAICEGGGCQRLCNTPRKLVCFSLPHAKSHVFSEGIISGILADHSSTVLQPIEWRPSLGYRFWFGLTPNGSVIGVYIWQKQCELTHFESEQKRLRQMGTRKYLRMRTCPLYPN
jgi:hypothetical protein